MTDQQELPEIRQARLERPPSPGQRVAGWATWHAGELAAVAGPSLVAVAVTPWAWVATAASGGAWLLHEVRQARSRRALQHEQSAESGAVTSTNTTDAGASEHDEHEQTDDVPDEDEIEVRHG